MKLGEALLHALKAAGARAVFGLPGDYALPFFEVMEQSKILPLYTLSHEPGIGFAADGAARYGGGVGVAAVTYGAGAMNLVNTVGCAWAERSPLVVISGAPGARDGDSGLLLHHQIRTHETQMNVFREFTCDQIRLDDPVEAPAQIARVIHSCLKHSQPVYIEFPRDMVGAECEPISHNFSQQPAIPPSLLQECIQDITERLSKALHPAILAGSQLRRFGLEDSMFELASRWSMPLLNSFMGKGLFAGKSWPYLGSYLGLAGKDELREVIEDADLAFIFGVIPSDTNWGASGKPLDAGRMIVATADGVAVCGRRYAGLTLKTLVPALHTIAFKATVVPPPDVTSLPFVVYSDIPLKADDIAPILQQALEWSGETLPLVLDVGDCLFVGMEMERMPVLASAYYATMGFGVPAALGLQAATGDRPVIITGDGGFQMTGWELINCIRYGWDPIVIVINNSSWEMLRQFQPNSHYTQLSQVSYAALAKELGGKGTRVESAAQLASALESALQKRGLFQLIELVIAPGDCTSTMRRYTSAIKVKIQKAT